VEAGRQTAAGPALGLRSLAGAAAALAGLVYLSSLSFLAFRTALAILGLISGIMAGRLARNALTKAQPAP
jgi:hypothetical protein